MLSAPKATRFSTLCMSQILWTPHHGAELRLMKWTKSAVKVMETCTCMYELILRKTINKASLWWGRELFWSSLLSITASSNTSAPRCHGSPWAPLIAHDENILLWLKRRALAGGICKKRHLGQRNWHWRLEYVFNFNHSRYLITVPSFYTFYFSVNDCKQKNRRVRKINSLRNLNTSQN